MPRTETMDAPPAGVVSSLLRSREMVNLIRSRAEGAGVGVFQPAWRSVVKCWTVLRGVRGGQGRGTRWWTGAGGSPRPMPGAVGSPVVAGRRRRCRRAGVRRPG